VHAETAEDRAADAGSARRSALHNVNKASSEAQRWSTVLLEALEPAGLCPCWHSSLPCLRTISRTRGSTRALRCHGGQGTRTHRRLLRQLIGTSALPPHSRRPVCVRCCARVTMTDTQAGQGRGEGWTRAGGNSVGVGRGARVRLPVRVCRHVEPRGFLCLHAAPARRLGWRWPRRRRQEVGSAAAGWRWPRRREVQRCRARISSRSAPAGEFLARRRARSFLPPSPLPPPLPRPSSPPSEPPIMVRRAHLRCAACAACARAALCIAASAPSAGAERGRYGVQTRSSAQVQKCVRARADAVLSRRCCSPLTR
jgi:hypothetical protein